MREDIIYKLKTLQSIEPEEALKAGRKRKLMEKISVFGVRNDIFLSSSDIYTTKNKFAFGFSFSNRFAASMASLAFIFASGVWTVGAAQSSLPGDALYQVKKAGEHVSLAIASEQDKPKVEITLAGKRLEELAEISQRTSDSNQHKKVEKLVSDFQEKVNSANDRLSKLNEKGKKDETVKVAGTARIVNEQSEKYSEVLQKTTQNLPLAVKDRVAVKVAQATTTTEKINLSSLMVMVESKEPQNAQEIVAKVQKTIDKAEVKVNELSVQNAAASAAQPAPCVSSTTGDKDQNAIAEACPVQDKTDNPAEKTLMTEEAKKKLEEAKENLKNSNLTDTLKNVSQATEIVAQVVPAPVQPVQTDPAPQVTSVPVSQN